MKKITSMVLILAILCCTLAVLVSCGGKTKHTHSYGAWSVSSNATCTAPGLKSKSCSCGDVITEPIPAMGHNIVGGVCTDCGETE